MSKIISHLTMATSNIQGFAQQLASSPDLQGRLSYARAWYALRRLDGGWEFGPSKFIGYEGMTAEDYTKTDTLNGRETERKLETWFSVVGEDHPLYEDLSEHLTDFLHQYGKSPSTKMRINVLKSEFDKALDNDNGLYSRDVEDLIIAVVGKLPLKSRSRIKNAI